LIAWETHDAADAAPARLLRPDARAAAAIRAFAAPWRLVVAAFLASRLALLAVGLMTQIYIEPIARQVSPTRLTQNPVLRIWAQWDAGWYRSIAVHGYAAHAHPDGSANWAFFPAYPFISAAVARLSHMPVLAAMLVVANASFLAALFVIHRLTRVEFDERTADLTVLLLCAVPGSYIFSSGYTESLFILAVSSCLLLLRRERWLAAGGAAGLAALTRNLGVGLLLPFVMAAGPRLWALAEEAGRGVMLARGRLVREGGRIAGGLLIPAVALGAFCLLLYLRCGDPLAFMTTQRAWGRAVGNPFAGLARSLFAPAQVQDGDLLSLAAAWLALGMLAALALMRRWRLFVLAAFLVFLPLSTGLVSFARYSLAALPLFMAGAKLLAPRPAAAVATLTAFAVLNGFMMVAWTLGLWVTA
jgi:hypothetical protein